MHLKVSLDFLQLGWRVQPIRMRAWGGRACARQQRSGCMRRDGKRGGALQEGRIYRLGGLDENYEALDTCQRFDPDTNEWETSLGRAARPHRSVLGV